MSGSVVGGEFDYQLASGLSASELKFGDILILAPYQHLKLVAQLVPELSVFTDDELLDLGSTHCMVSQLPECLIKKSPRASLSHASLDDWDGFIGVNIISRGIELRLPLAAIDDRVEIDLDEDMEGEDIPNVTDFAGGEWSYSDRQYEVDEPLETSMEIKFSQLPVEDRRKQAGENYSIPQYMAAETIQQAWKNYGRFRDMKESYQNKMQRISSSEKLVMDIAADMIKKTYMQSKAYTKKNRREMNNNYPDIFPELGTIPTRGVHVPTSTSIPRGSKREDKESYYSPRSVGRTSHIMPDDNTADNMPMNPQPQPIISADSKMFIEIVDVTCKDLTKVNWDSPNDPFVEFLSAEWTRKTPTRWESGSEANWQHPGILIPIDSIGVDSSVFLRVYSANLVRENMLIGECRLTLGDEYFLPSSPILNKKNTIELTLEDVTRMKTAGSVSVVAVLREGEEYALLEAKLAVENAEKSVKEEEAENYRLELMKKRQEKEAASSAAAARKKEAKRLAKVQARQELEASALQEELPQRNEGSNTENMKAPKRSATPNKKKSSKANASDSRKVSKLSVEISESQEPVAPRESKQEFKFTTGHTKKAASSRVSQRKAEAKAEAKAIEIEPLYSDGKSEPKLSSSADEYLKKALNEHPKLFEVRGEKKEMTSPVKTEAPEISIPRRQQMSFIERNIPLKAEEKESIDAKHEDKAASAKRPGQENDSVANFTSNSATTKPQPLLVIDKAFQQAKKAVCSIISLMLSEVIVLLGALDISVARKDADRPGSSNSNEYVDATVELSLTSISAFAGALTSHVRKYDLMEESNSFVCSEEIASRAINNLNVLVEGPWKRTRSLILKLCKKTSKRKSCCPSKWSSESINILLSQLQVRSGRELSNGMEFLELSSVDSLFFYSAAAPSLLKYRLTLHQKLLCYLDDWWDLEPRQRPWDEMLKNGDGSVTREKGKYRYKTSSTVPPLSSSSSSSSSAAAAAAQPPPSRDVKDGDYIKICEADELLRDMMSINRGLGWNLSIDQVTLLSSRLAGLKGKVTTSNLELPVVKGCRWVLLTPQTSGRPGLAKDFKGLMELNIIKNLEDDLRPSCIAVLIPILCLDILAPENQLMSPKAVRVGQKISIAPLASLRNSVSRFEWYDRPEDTMLEEIAGSVGEVVSIAELDGTGRVGVEFKLSRGSIIEGIPIEALRNGAPKTPAGIKSPQVSRRQDNSSPRAQLAEKRLSYFDKGTSNNDTNTIMNFNIEKDDGMKRRMSREKEKDSHVDLMLDIGHTARNSIRSSISQAIDRHVESKSPDAEEAKVERIVADPPALIDDELINDLNQYYEGDMRRTGLSGPRHDAAEWSIDEDGEPHIEITQEEKREYEDGVEHFVPEVRKPKIIIAAPGTSAASKLYRPTTTGGNERREDPLVEAMKQDPRARDGPRTLNNPSGIYVTKLDVPPTKVPSPVRKPLYRPPEPEKKVRPQTAPLKMKSYAWLNPQGDLFERPSSPITNASMNPNPPFQAFDDEKEFVPVTKTYGKPPNSSKTKLRPAPIQDFQYETNEQEGDVETSPRLALPTPSLDEARPPTLSYQVYNDWGDGLFDDVKPTEEMKKLMDRNKPAVTKKVKSKKKQKEVLDADDMDDVLIGEEDFSKAQFSLQGRGLVSR